VSAAGAIVWFRRDLRLTDNPALQAALAVGGPLLAVYIHAPWEDEPWPQGAASRWWLHHSLGALHEALCARGNRLVLRAGSAAQVLPELVRTGGAGQVHASLRVEPAARRQQQAVGQALAAMGARLVLHDAGLLASPRRLLGTGERPYRVFTPFWRRLRAELVDGDGVLAPERLAPAPRTVASLPLAELDLLPRHAWTDRLGSVWQPGEAGAHTRLRQAVEQVLPTYAHQRDRPDLASTTRLSAHLHFGEIGPRQVVAAVRAAAAAQPALDTAAEAVLRELGWREFSQHLLWHYPQLPDRALDARFEHFPWRDDPLALRAWQRGQTGIPLVDAGLRELWQTGFMHNRVRMVVASFLTKHLRLPWQDGARWFWDTLVDADLACNSQNWQWVAGCGADAAPYFRIFNPVLQGEKFDPDGAYVRRWLPQLARLPARYIHAPWRAPQTPLAEAGVRLGVSYPPPIVDLAAGRAAALAAFAQIRRG
jgi:deoxyribodipyrimidine photo-lyase